MEISNIGEIVLYQPDNSIRLEVRVENETVWLSQAQMVVLFDSSKANISEHIKNVYETGELIENATVRKFRTVQIEGKRNVNRTIEHYNLDMIIAIGYRVNTKRGTQFRQWANPVLKDYLLRGYAINRHIERMENFAIETERRLTQAETKIDILIHHVEDVVADYNDINEDTRMQLEQISMILAKIQANQKLIDKPRNPIGFNT